MQWDISHAQSYVNSLLCGSTDSGYDVAGGTGWGNTSMDISVDLSLASPQQNQTSGGTGDSSGSDSLLVGAWRGAPDGVGVDRLGGYFTGLLDNLEVRDYRWIEPCVDLFWPYRSKFCVGNLRYRRRMIVQDRT